MTPTDPVALTAALVRCASVTPKDEGALETVAQVLGVLGFTLHRLPFAAPGTAPIGNLYARLGTNAPFVLLAGHTDVVPPGDEAAWTHPPFSAAIADGILYGRGAVDMKSGLAAQLSAVARYLEKNGPPQGSIGFLITGDEEGPAVNGTAPVIDWMRTAGIVPDLCLLAEPTSVATVGDTLKVGRRGSLSAEIVITGIQGHVAYPDKAANPLRALPMLLEALHAPLDAGTADFSASNLEIVSIDTGNGALNVIPQSVTLRLNVRFNDNHTIETLARTLHARASAAITAPFSVTLTVLPGASSAFRVPEGAHRARVAQSVARITGTAPAFSTGGGTSDARFIKDLCPVIELGLVGTTMHQVNECVPVADIERLTQIYEAVVSDFLAE